MNRSTRFHRRLSVQIALTVAIVTSLVFGFTVWFAVGHQRETLTHELTLRLLSESRNLSLASTSPLLRRDPELGLHPLILKAMSETADLVDLVVLDSRGVVQGHRDVLQVGEKYKFTGPRSFISLPLNQGEKAWLGASGNLFIEQPIRHLDQVIGTLVMCASRDGIESTIRRAQNRLLLFGAMGTIVAILSVVLLVGMNLRPLGALRDGVAKLGSGDLSTRVIVRSRNELGMFANLVNSMASGLQKAQNQRIQQERLDHELEIARELQSMLLPKVVTPAPGYRLEAHYTPALEVSGDYYDAFPLDERHIAITAADVSGKGVPGLVVMAMLRTFLQTNSAHVDPVEVLVEANRLLRGRMGRGMFVTCVYGVLDTMTHSFNYASAGHCPLLTYGSHGTRYVKSRGKPIGMFPEDILKNSLERGHVSLQSGDGFLLYTDGLVESLNARGDQLGFEAVTQVVNNWLQKPRGSLVKALLQRVETHRGTQPASDDLTLVALQRQSARVTSPAGKGVRT